MISNACPASPPHIGRDKSGPNADWSSLSMSMFFLRNNRSHTQMGRAYACYERLRGRTAKAASGWNMSKRIDTQLALGALEKALVTRDVRPGLIHYSDRGVQYARTAYVEWLLSGQAHISMSATGNSYDNAKAKSFFKTLKQEEVYLKQYQTFDIKSN